MKIGRGAWKLAALGLGLLVLAACVPESANPLSAQDQAAADPRLFGRWRGQFEDETSYLHILQKDDALAEIVMVNHQQDHGGSWSVLSAFPTRLGAATYLNVKFLTDGDKPANDDVSNFYICRYEVTADGALLVWTMSEDAVAAAIAGGSLAGSVEKGRYIDTIKITAGSAELAAFVAKSDPRRLFARKFAEFHRIP